MIQFTPCHARFYSGRTRRGIHVNPFHRPEVNDETVIAQADACYVMTSAQNRGGNLVRARELDSRDHVSHTGTARDQSGVSVNHCIVNLASLVVGRLARAEELAAQRCSKMINR